MSLIIIVGECRAELLLPEFSIIKALDVPLIDCPNAAVIMGRNAHSEIRSALGVVIDSDDPAALPPRSVQLITCGVSPKNTVCITSRTPQKLTISLNRSIRAASGVCEPLEFPVEFTEGFSEYELMAAFTARLLLK